MGDAGLQLQEASVVVLVVGGGERMGLVQACQAPPGLVQLVIGQHNHLAFFFLFNCEFVGFKMLTRRELFCGWSELLRVALRLVHLRAYSFEVNNLLNEEKLTDEERMN